MVRLRAPPQGTVLGRHRVLVTAPLPGDPDALGDHELFGAVERGRHLTRDELLAEVATADGLLCLLTDDIDAAVLDAGSRLRVVGNIAVGYDNVDVDAATRAGVLVCNTPGVLDETVADLAFALILAACRRMSEASSELRAGAWPGWDINQHLGRDVHGARLGLVGYGRIGRAVARRASGFDMQVLHHTRTPTGEDGYVADLDELLGIADIVSLHVPLSTGTRHLIGGPELALMKDTAVLVNTSRGPVVDEAALARALHEDEIFAAGLDVYEDEPAVHDELLTAPNAVLTPHIGSASVQTRAAMVQLAAQGVADALEGRVPAHSVNPDVLDGATPATDG